MQLQLVVALYIVWVTPFRVVRGRGGYSASVYVHLRLEAVCATFQVQTSTNQQPNTHAYTQTKGFNMPAEGVWFWVEGAIDAFFYADLALNFFVAYEVRRGI
jgi:hypothetical protein